MRRRLKVTPTPWDIQHAKYLAEVERQQLELDRLDALREWAEWRANAERFGSRKPRVPAAPGYDAAARRLGCEDHYDNDLNARYGEGW